MKIDTIKIRTALELIIFIQKYGGINYISLESDEINCYVNTENIVDFISICPSFFKEGRQVTMFESNVNFNLVEIFNFYSIEYKKLNLIFKNGDGEEI